MTTHPNEKEATCKIYLVLGGNIASSGKCAHVINEAGFSLLKNSGPLYRKRFVLFCLFVCLFMTLLHLSHLAKPFWLPPLITLVPGGIGYSYLSSSAVLKTPAATPYKMSSSQNPRHCVRKD